MDTLDEPGLEGPEILEEMDTRSHEMPTHQTRPVKGLKSPIVVPKREKPLKADPKARGASNSNEIVLEERRRIVGALYLQGKSAMQIALQLDVSQATIYTDLKAIRADWVAQGIESFDEAKAKELAGLDVAESELWDAWFLSKADKETKIIRLKKSPDVPSKFRGSQQDKTHTDRVLAEGAEKLRIIEKNIELTRTGQCGNPAFMAQIIQIKEMRLKIIGAFKESEKGGVNIFNINWEQLHGKPTDDEDPIEQRIAQVRQLPAHKPGSSDET